MSTLIVNKNYIKELTSRIQDLYCSDHIPWIVGYSGGKDSTATLQLVWYSLQELAQEKRLHKEVHVISTDTLVEQPVVAAWVNRSLALMKQKAKELNLPVFVHRLTPEITDSYWVNLIGRGYPAPRPGFRWCTSRLKIDPSNRFIRNLVKEFGETILVLGTRKSESIRRGMTMRYYEKKRIREWLSPNGSLQNSWVFSPIEDWSSDDVWLYLNQYPNPWGISNKDLQAMYREATKDNDCPLVVDTTTPSCGNSRFGCWVCTLVTEDKSMEAMIQNDEEKQWMTPLLEFRNKYIGKLNQQGRIDDHKHRDFRRMDGKIKLYGNKYDEKPVPGPYTKKRREELLKELLKVQKEVQSLMPPEMEGLELITMDELRKIRDIWVNEKFEFDDSLPRIYQEVTGKPWPDETKYSQFGAEEWKLLEDLTSGDTVALDLQASLLMLEEQNENLKVRKSVLEEIEKHIRRCYYADVEDAKEFKKREIELKALNLESLDKFTQEDGTSA